MRGKSLTAVRSPAPDQFAERLKTSPFSAPGPASRRRTACLLRGRRHAHSACSTRRSAADNPPSTTRTLRLGRTETGARRPACQGRRAAVISGRASASVRRSGGPGARERHQPLERTGVAAHGIAQTWRAARAGKIRKRRRPSIRIGFEVVVIHGQDASQRFPPSQVDERGVREIHGSVTIARH